LNRLNEIIFHYGRWSELLTYTERIDAYILTDFSQALENSKALLETISKEICLAKGVELNGSASINATLKKAFAAIGFKGDALVTQISSALANIGQQMGNLRNDIGTTSHGKTLEEIKQRNDQVDEISKEFLIETTVIVASFLIRTFESENPRDGVNPLDLNFRYEGQVDFNDYWDDSFGEFVMGEYSFPASEILFYVDYNDYLREYEIFTKDEG